MRGKEQGRRAKAERQSGWGGVFETTAPSPKLPEISARLNNPTDIWVHKRNLRFGPSISGVSAIGGWVSRRGKTREFGERIA